MSNGEQLCSPENLYTVGRGIWKLVTESTTKEGRKDNIRGFWIGFIYELRRRLPRSSTTEEWVELLNLPDARPANAAAKDDPRLTTWKAFLDRWINPLFMDLPPEAEAALEPYRQSVIGKFSEISLSGFGGPGAQSEAEGKAELARVYVDLDAKAEAGRPQQTQSPEPGQPATDRVPALERIALDPRLVLIGLPGSGKSTLLKFFSLCLAHCGLQPEPDWLAHLQLWPKEETDLIPVFVELRQFAASFSGKIPEVDKGQHLTNYILAQLKPSPLEKCADALIQALARGRAIIFLDGLDEVPDDDSLRRFVLKTVEAFAEGPLKASRIVVSCRPRSYDDPKWQLKGFEKAELTDLDKPKIESFIGRFYEEVARRNRDFAAKKADRITKLKQAVQREELRELAANPFMLTVMAWLHRFEELPKKRAAILNRLVEMLLFKWEELRLRDDEGHPEPKLTELLKRHDLEVASLRRAICRLAFQARQAGPPSANGKPAPVCVSIAKAKLLSALAELPDREKHSQHTREQWALDVIHVIDRRTGLLVPEGGDCFTMPYKLQEFLAGENLTDRDELEAVGAAVGLKLEKPPFDRVVSQLVGENGYWEEVVKWAAAIQAHVNRSPADARDLALELCSAKAPTAITAVRRAVVAGEVLWEVGPQEIKNTHRQYGPNCLKRVRDTLDAMMVREHLAPNHRADAGEARGWLENLPQGVGLRKDGLPDLQFVPAEPEEPLPARKIILGETKKPVTIEQPYRISRYPITVAQFQAFVDAPDGYQEARHWTWLKEAEAWWKSNQEKGPENYDPVFQTPNHPRVGVCWFEAMAFCRWLTERLRAGNRRRESAPTQEAQRGLTSAATGQFEIRLPREAEWEQAARWDGKRADDRTYPWGACDEKELAQHCNCHQTGIGHTSAVGLFPSGDAKCGAADMAGNVWEWCENWYDERANTSRGVRGGSWIFNPESLRSACRYNFTPDDRGIYLGFRCVWVAGFSP